MIYTLGHYRNLAALMDRPDGEAIKYFDRKIAESPRGADEPVLADESQMLMLLGSLLGRGSK
jgi:hypothetical protein